VTDVTSRHGWDVLISTVDADTIEYTVEITLNGR
jgi:hypothetical protein